MKVLCTISQGDKQSYCVRNRKNLTKTEHLLANVCDRLTQLVAHLNQKMSNRLFVKRLVENFDPHSIQETLPTDIHVAYTENKGDKMAFCTTTKRNSGKIIDINTLTYVAIHELAHVACESIGHTEEFWNIFKTMLIEASRIEIYKPVDYSDKPVSYCGTKIDQNIIFDNK